MLDHDDINYLLSYDDASLLAEFKKLSRDKKKIILSSKNIKGRFINYSSDKFAILINYLDKELLETFLDKDGIELLLNSCDLFYKLTELITLKSEVVDEVLTNEKVLAKLYNYDEFYPLLKNKNINFVQKYFDYLIDNNKDLTKISYCSENLNEILKNSENVDKIIKGNLIKPNDFFKYDVKSLGVMFENPYFRDMVLNVNYDISNLIFKEVSFGEEFFKDKRFIEKLVDENDVTKYRFMINSLQKNNSLMYLDDIERKRKVYYDDIINSYDENLGMFKKYAGMFNSLVIDNKLVDQQTLFDLDLNSKLPYGLNYEINIVFFNSAYKQMSEEGRIEQLKNIFHKASCLDFCEILVDRYYEDVAYNFQLDLESLIKFNNDEQVISTENMRRYLKLLMILENKNVVDIDFYNTFDKNKNYVEEYYDDFSISRKKSYSLINDSLVKCEDIENQKNKELSALYGVDVYEFKGEKFYMMIHNTSKLKDDFESVDSVFQKSSLRDGTSMSLISDLKMDFFNDTYYETVILGFNKLDINSFVHIYKTDSFSNYKKKDNVASNKQNQLYTPASLMKDTIGYNEIVYQVRTENTRYLAKPLKPSYVVVFDNIRDADIAVAKKFNIPIVRIDRTKYKNCEYRITGNDDAGIFGYDEYMSSYNELRNKLR